MPVKLLLNHLVNHQTGEIYGKLFVQLIDGICVGSASQGIYLGNVGRDQYGSTTHLEVPLEVSKWLANGFLITYL